jgi:hypothetical protein
MIFLFLNTERNVFLTFLRQNFNDEESDVFSKPNFSLPLLVCTYTPSIWFDISFNCVNLALVGFVA